MGILISIYNGVNGSKSTEMTKMLATFINYYYNASMSVIDANPLMPIFKARQYELEELNVGLRYLTGTIDKLTEKGKTLYPIHTSGIDDIALIETFTKKYDVTFIDIPIDLSTENKRKIISRLDFIFIPFSTKEVIFHEQIETLDLATIISREDGSRLRDFGVFLYHPFNENNREQQLAIEAFFRGRLLDVMYNFYVDYKELKYSTIVPVPYSNKTKGISEFADTIFNKL